MFFLKQLMSGTQKFIESGKNFFSEKRCYSCFSAFTPPLKSNSFPDDYKRSPLLPEHFFCQQCLPLLHQQPRQSCPLCGTPFLQPKESLAPCGRCISAPPPWQRAMFFGPHEGLLRELLLQYKFSHQIGLAYPLGALLTQVVTTLQESTEITCIIPVPLHRSRIQQRGFNQSLELARFPSRALALPLCPELLQRTRKTVSQRELSREKRQSNVNGAFTASSAVLGQKVLLVDDTMTTGATLKAATLALLQAGAIEVSLAIVSRTPITRQELHLGEAKQP